MIFTCLFVELQETHFIYVVAKEKKNQKIWSTVHFLPQISCLVLRKSLNLSEPCFSYL